MVDASGWISVEGNPAQNWILFCLGQLIEQGKIQCPPEAWDEVEKCPWVKAWLEPNYGQFVRRINDVEYMLLVGRVTHQFARLGVSLQVVEAVLGHISGSRAGVVVVYQRHAYDAEKKMALDAWARHVAAIVSGQSAKVIPLRNRRRKGASP